MPIWLISFYILVLLLTGALGLQAGAAGRGRARPARDSTSRSERRRNA
jgi:hypothetical protein